MHFPLKHTTSEFHSKTMKTTIWGAYYRFFYEQEIKDRKSGTGCSQNRLWLFFLTWGHQLVASGPDGDNSCFIWLMWQFWKLKLVTTLKLGRFQVTVQISGFFGKTGKSDHTGRVLSHVTNQLVFKFVISVLIMIKTQNDNSESCSKKYSS